MKSARSVYDELTTTQAIKRVGVIPDMSTLVWYYSSQVFYAAIPNIKVWSSNNFVTPLYLTGGYPNDKGTGIYEKNLLYIRDLAFTNVDDFKKHIKNVPLFYEMAKEEVINLPEPLNLDYKASDFGTEEAVMDDNSAPLKANIVYGFNAVDTIRNNRLDIANETQRATNVEAILQESIQTEISRAQATESQLQQSITSEKQRAESAESALAEGKADKDGYYSKLTTGFSDNLVGRGEAVGAQFSFRPSGATQSIEDGVAHIERIKGNTIVWNQLAQPKEPITTEGLTIESIGDGSYKLHTVTDTPTTADVFFPVTDKFIRGRKIVFYGGTTTCVLKSSSGVRDIGAGAIIASAIADEVVGIFVAAGTIINTAVTIFPQVFDVTKMFGTGAAITTVREFRKLFPKADNAYNVGELLSFNAEAITTVGFNQFDKTKAQYGTISASTVIYDYNVHGNKFYVSDYIRIVPSEKYYFKNIVGRYYWTAVQALDANKQYVGWYMPIQAATDKKADSFIADFSDRPQICYIRICLPADCLDSCCVNLVHTGYRNGDYESYEETTRMLPIKEYFPDGMKSAKSIFDELTMTQAIKRVGIVEDLSKLDWVEGPTESGKKRFSASIGTSNSNGVDSNSVANILCPILNTLSAADTYFGYSTTGIIALTEGRLYLYNPNWQTVQNVKSALVGVPLTYELKTPVVTDLPEPLNLDYKVSDFGTEEAVYDGNSAPFKADIVYQFNAVDTIRGNSIDIADIKTALPVMSEKIDNEITKSQDFDNRITNAPNLALRMIFCAHGALYNDTSEVIKRIAPWGTESFVDGQLVITYDIEIDHLPGHYYLNGIGDITEEEMLEIYVAGFPEFESYRSPKKARTNICNHRTGGEGIAISLTAIIAGNKIMKVLNISKSGVVYCNNFVNSFYNSKVERILPNNIYINGTSTSAQPFRQATDLKTVYLRWVNFSLDFSSCSYLTKGSVWTMIKYVKDNVTHDITITLHPDVYNALVNDPDIISVLEETNARISGSISIDTVSE